MITPQFKRGGPGLALCSCLLLGACGPGLPEAGPVETLCQSEFTPITAVQGTGFESPLSESEVTVIGIVTRVEQGRGLYLEALTGAAGASRALYVFDDTVSKTTTSGTQLAIRGRVGEAGSGTDTLTSLSEVAETAACARGVELPLSRALLPMDADRREALEGMRIALEQDLSVADVYSLASGTLTLSSGGVLRVPTEDREPGEAARELGRSNRLRQIEAVLPDGPAGTWRVGSRMGPVTGIMGHDSREQKLLLETAPTGNARAPAPVAPPARGQLRVVSLNLLNFFNGDGLGGGFPTERGAKTPAEHEAQKGRIRAAVAAMQPDLLAVQELENDGFGPLSAAHSLLEVLNEAWGGDWAAAMPGPGPIGGDTITVGIFYRSRVLAPAGPAEVLDDAAFRGLSRAPLAQAFRDAGGGVLLVAVNHLKSKGRCPKANPAEDPNADQGDGQSCWNAARVAAVRAELPWLRNLAGKAATDRVLVLGDMNAWRLEDPIRQFAAGGFVDIVERLSGLPQYSFIYFGERGTLDYAFASPTLADSTARARIWHIDADWPARVPLPEPWLRTSDHDPVLVDIAASQSSASD